MRTLIMFVSCWVAVGAWLCWDDGDVQAVFSHRPVFWLGVYLSFIYPLAALVPAALIAVLCGYALKLAWWLRGSLAGAVGGGIVTVFLVSTQQFGLLPVLAFAVIGFALGCTSSPSIGGWGAEPDASPKGAAGTLVGNSRASEGPPSVS